jgi:hypothetical protein
MAKEPRNLRRFGAGDPNYVKDMMESGRKLGKIARVPNPNKDKMISTGAKPKVTKPVVKPKSKLTGADITGQKYNTKIKEEAAKIKLKVKMKEKLTPYEKSVIGSDAAIRRMNTKAVSKTSTKKK